MNTKVRKVIINAAIFIFFVVLTFYILLKDNDILEILQIIKEVDKTFIVIAVLCMCFFVIAEGTNIARTLKLLNCKISFVKGIKYALVGFFFSSVTPGSSGGDPMQLYYMKKDGMPIGHSALAILTEFSSFQFITILIAIISFIAKYKFIESSIGNIKYLLILGVAINTVILAILLLSIFSNRIIVSLVNFICRILEKAHYKKVERFREKCFENIKEYKRGAMLLMRNKRVLLKILLTTTIQVILYHSIPYFIYLSFGLTEANLFEFVALQAVLYISVSSIPIPGAVGVSEGGFLVIYNLLFPATLLSSAMLLSRGVSFYLFLIVSGISILLFSLKRNKREIRVM